MINFNTDFVFSCFFKAQCCFHQYFSIVFFSQSSDRAERTRSEARLLDGQNAPADTHVHGGPFLGSLPSTPPASVNHQPVLAGLLAEQNFPAWAASITSRITPSIASKVAPGRQPYSQCLLRIHRFVHLDQFKDRDPLRLLRLILLSFHLSVPGGYGSQVG